MTLCGAPQPGGLFLCTRRPHHPGDHIATIGPYHEGEPIIAQWSAPPRMAFHGHLDECAHCREHPLSLCPTGARLLREAVDASDRP